jgi:quinol monooxygenase YgiN
MPTPSPKGKLMTCSTLVAFELFASLLPTAMPVSAATPEVSATPGAYICNVFELRQYTLKPGQRDVLIELFDREFVETQEAVGMRVCGQFRDEDHPERFVWIRAFADMKARERGLTSFYSGPAWKAHGKHAAATMVDSDNVLLLRPVDPPGGFNDLPAKRPSVGAPAPPSALVIATIYSLRAETRREFASFFRERLLPALRDSGITPRAVFATEHSPNTYPALPVREGEEVVVWFASFENTEALAASADRLSRSDHRAQVNSELETYLRAPPELLRLRPTGRSLLR